MALVIFLEHLVWTIPNEMLNVYDMFSKKLNDKARSLCQIKDFKFPIFLGKQLDIDSVFTLCETPFSLQHVTWASSRWFYICKARSGFVENYFQMCCLELVAVKERMADASQSMYYGSIMWDKKWQSLNCALRERRSNKPIKCASVPSRLLATMWCGVAAHRYSAIVALVALSWLGHILHSHYFAENVAIWREKKIYCSFLITHEPF